MKEAFCDCSISEFSVFENCFDEYSLSEYASKPFTKWTDAEKTCKDFRILQYCINHSIINHCANTIGFTKYAKSRNIGARRAANYWHLNFMCGKGYEAAKNTFPCLISNEKNCSVSNCACTCDLIHDNINVCSKNLKGRCGQDAYEYSYGTLATGYCHTNPECEFLQEYCSEIHDYANAASETEKLRNDEIVGHQTNHPETTLLAKIISAKEISVEEVESKEQFLSVLILRSLSRLSLDFIHLIMEENAVPHLIKLLESSDLDLQEQAILALGNIIGSDSDLRDYCIEHGIIKSLNKIIFSPDSQIRIIRHCAWVLKNLIGQNDMILSDNEMDKLLPALKEFLKYDNDTFILADTFSGIYGFSHKSSTRIHYFINHGIVESVIQHLSNNNLKIQSSALGSVIGFLRNDRDQIKYLIDNGILNSISELLKINNKHALFVLNHLVINHHEFIQQLFDSVLIPSIVSGLLSDFLDVQCNSLYAINSIIDHENSNYTIKLLQMNTVFNLCKFLIKLDTSNQRLKETQLIVLTINMMFKNNIKYHYQIVKQMKNSGGLDTLERLQNHKDKKVRAFATHFYQQIQEYLLSEEDEEEEEYILHDEF
uniref:Uncharacterized protein n=1 Tax=Panagrolaimus davidi TaxID=227884 RepID=A0A914QAX9_9BILA